MNEAVVTQIQGLAGKYRPYPQYKVSGVEWLGDVPSHWVLPKFKWQPITGNEFASGPFGSSIGSQFYVDEGVPIIRGNNLSLNASKPRFKNTGYVYLEPKKAIELRNAEVRSGDLVFTARGTVGQVGLIPSCEELGWDSAILSANQLRYRPSNPELDPEFIWYLFSSWFVLTQVYLSSDSVAQPNLNLGSLRDIRLLLPPVGEQQTIAAFLDYETARMDRLITQQHRLIELLKEKRQAVISHAVTKGLNPNALMKDSGVEWLGQVPEHWVVSKFAFLKEVLTDYTANGSFADLKANVRYFDEPSFARLVRLTDLRKDLQNENGVWIDENAYKYLNKSALYGGEFLLANVGAYAGLFYQMPFNKGPASLAPNMFMAKFDSRRVTREFMAYVGQSVAIESQFKLSATASSAQPKLNKDDFKSVIFCYPQIHEQVDIVRYLDRELSKIDKLLIRQSEAVDLMSERRTALISAAVTGKIDLRGWTRPAEEAAA